MENETAQARILACVCVCVCVCVFFVFFFSFLFVWKCDERFVDFLHIVAKSPSAFHNKWTNIRPCEQKILNKYNKFG